MQINPPENEDIGTQSFVLDSELVDSFQGKIDLISDKTNSSKFSIGNDQMSSSGVSIPKSPIFPADAKPPEETR